MMKRQMALVLTLVVATTGCKVWHHGKAGVHGVPPAAPAPGAATDTTYNLPPSVMLMHPGPGVDGPGPGVLIPEPAAVVPARVSQVHFVGPPGMYVRWDMTLPGAFDSPPLVVPGRYNFPQGAIYRLKLTNIPAFPGVELYPTLEVGPTMPRTDAFLAHNAIPVQFTDEDFNQVLSGNFVTKVIYLPDPEFQDIAIAAGVETLVSTRLDPGVDPIIEADRRGSIMAIVRIGNKDLRVGAPGADVELVAPASYNAPLPHPHANPLPYSFEAATGAELQPGTYPPAYAAAGLPGQPYPMQPAPAPTYVSGVTTPMYGMPITGTPIGLPGPPHLPLGGPAGLCMHTIKDHTVQHIPHPVHHFDIHVKQQPGLSYPKPVSQVHVHEQVIPTAPLPPPCADCPPGHHPVPGRPW